MEALKPLNPSLLRLETNFLNGVLWANGYGVRNLVSVSNG